jgi:hypothetical protein
LADKADEHCHHETACGQMWWRTRLMSNIAMRWPNTLKRWQSLHWLMEDVSTNWQNTPQH